MQTDSVQLMNKLGALENAHLLNISSTSVPQAGEIRYQIVGNLLKIIIIMQLQSEVLRDCSSLHLMQKQLQVLSAKKAAITKPAFDAFLSMAARLSQKSKTYKDERLEYFMGMFNNNTCLLSSEKTMLSRVERFSIHFD